jgi:plasmid stabilization system protein ParE
MSSHHLLSTTFSSGCVAGESRRKPQSVAYKAVFRRRIEQRLTELARYIASKANSAEIPYGYLKRIDALCQALAGMPEGGAPRDDIMPGLRT